MPEINKKRKATDQLSPYSEDLTNESRENASGATSALESSQSIPNFKKARARKETGVTNPSLKGIFGTVSLASDENKNTVHSKDEMIAGLNNSLIKCLEKILKKQPNKDVSYIFVQYTKFLRDIEENNK